MCLCYVRVCLCCVRVCVCVCTGGEGAPSIFAYFSTIWVVPAEYVRRTRLSVSVRPNSAPAQGVVTGFG